MQVRFQETYDDEDCADADAEAAEDGAGLQAPIDAGDASDVASAVSASSSPPSAATEATSRSSPAVDPADWRSLAKRLMDSRPQVVPAPAALEAADAEVRSNMTRYIEPAQEAMREKAAPDTLGYQEKLDRCESGTVYR